MNREIITVNEENVEQFFNFENRTNFRQMEVDEILGSYEKSFKDKIHVREN
jgi:hypothetical protein